ncbi:hypothetical protein AcW2_001091 [Taiwanofungus camphoratus]|nr:hypothetical protein AcW2_001091 [Antrodia cinnamomea]
MIMCFCSSVTISDIYVTFDVRFKPSHRLVVLAGSDKVAANATRKGKDGRMYRWTLNSTADLFSNEFVHIQPIRSSLDIRHRGSNVNQLTLTADEIIRDGLGQHERNTKRGEGFTVQLAATF